MKKGITRLREKIGSELDILTREFGQMGKAVDGENKKRREAMERVELRNFADVQCLKDQEIQAPT